LWTEVKKGEESMTETELQSIKIIADPKSASTCTFTVDRPVYPDSSYFFGSKESAEGSPLAERLFQIPSIKSALIAHNRLTITKDGFEDWVPTARQIGQAVRQHLASGQPAVSTALRDRIPPAEDIRRRVQEVFDGRINPAVAMHGGFVQLIDVQGNTVFIQMGGGCQGCGMADVTLKQGIEVEIRAAVPEVGEILDTTDHAAGRNPYYTPSRK
jgi:Fe-S cluster biogenesis protein NfuA